MGISWRRVAVIQLAALVARTAGGSDLYLDNLLGETTQTPVPNDR
jgi:hypothetical protein